MTTLLPGGTINGSGVLSAANNDTDDIYSFTIPSGYTETITISATLSSPAAFVETSGFGPGGYLNYPNQLPYTTPTPLGPGTYELEFSTSNASVSQSYSFSISAAGGSSRQLPDLKPEVLVLNPNVVQAGHSITVQYDISNVGNASAGSSETTIYLSKANDINAGDVISSVTLSDPSVAAGSYFGDSSTFSIPSNLSGTYYVLVDANSNNAIEENSTSNNIISDQLDVTSSSSPSHVNPSVTAISSITISETQSISGPSLINSISNPSGDNITLYIYEDRGGGTGYFTLNGVRQSDGAWIYPNPGDTVRYIGGTSPGTDQLAVGIYDESTNQYFYAPTAVAAITTGADVVSESAPSTLSTYTGVSMAVTGVQISDPGAGGDTFATVVTANTGIVSMSGTGVSPTNGGLVVQGTLSQVNTALGTLQYNNGAVGADIITVATSDLTNQSSALEYIHVSTSYPENPGNNDEWLLHNGQWYASAEPGSHPNGYQVAGIGYFNDYATSGILWYNSTSGDTDEWQLSNTQWAASIDLGTHPRNATDGANYQIADIGDFFDNIVDGVLWTSPNSNGTIATDIWELGSNGKWSASVSPGNHPAGYVVAGIGDWTGNNNDGILWNNPSTGDTDEWQLSDGVWSASVDLGSHPGSGWTIAGVGDFFDNGRDDVLWTSSSGGSVQTDIWELGSNGKWADSVSPGTHPAGYQVVGVGDFNGDGTSDILWQNFASGDVDEWLINNGKWAASIDLGSHAGSGWHIAGIGNFTGSPTSDILWHNNS